MKPMKKIVALLMTVCMLVGMPWSMPVSAVGTPDSDTYTMPFQLTQALLIPDAWNTGLHTDRTLSLYFTGDVTIDMTATKAYITLVNSSGMAAKVDPEAGTSGTGSITSVWDATISQSTVFGSVNNYIVTLNQTQTRNSHELVDTIPEILDLAQKTNLTPVVRLRETSDPVTIDGITAQCANGKVLSIYEGTTLLDSTPNGLGDGGCNAAGQVIMNAETNTVNGYDYVDMPITTISDAPHIEYVEYDPSSTTTSNFRFVLSNGLYYTNRGSSYTPMHIRVVNSKGQIIYYNGSTYAAENQVVTSSGVTSGYYALGNLNNAISDVHGLNIERVLPQGSTMNTYSLAAMPCPQYPKTDNPVDWTGTYQTCLDACATLNARNDGETYGVALVIDENDSSSKIYASNGESANNWRIDALWADGYVVMPATHSNAELGISDRVIAPILSSDEIGDVALNDPSKLTLKTVSIVSSPGYADRVVIEFSKPLSSFTPSYAGLRVYAPQAVPSHDGTAMQWLVSGWVPYDSTGTRWVGNVNTRFSCDTLVEIQQWLVENNYATNNGMFALSDNRRLEFAIADSGSDTKNNRLIDHITATDGTVLFANDSPFNTGEERAGMAWNKIDLYDFIDIEDVTVYADKYVLIDFSQDVTVNNELFFRALCLYDTSLNTLAGRNADKTEYGAHTLGTPYQQEFTSFALFGNRQDVVVATLADGAYDWLTSEMEEANAWSVANNGSSSRFQLRLRMQDLVNDLPYNIEYAIQGITAVDNDYSLLHTASGEWSTLYYDPTVHEHTIAELTDVALQGSNQAIVSFSTEIQSVDPSMFSLIYADGTAIFGDTADINGTAVTITFPDAVFQDGMSLRIYGGQNFTIGSTVIETVDQSVIYANETETTAFLPCRISDSAASVKRNGIPYVEFSNAWAEKASGDTFTLCRDLTLPGVTVIDAGLILDLNGCTLTAPQLLVFGNVIDSSNGEGLLKIDRTNSSDFILLQQENTMLPLYDNTDKGYRFFVYDIVNRGTREITSENTVTAIKYGIQLYFSNTTAYQLLLDAANADISLTLELILRRPNSSDTTITYTFSNRILRAYANAILNNSGNTIVLKLYGMDTLAAQAQSWPISTTIDATSSITSGTGVTHDSTRELYHVGITPAQAAVNWIRPHMINNDLISFTYNGSPANLSTWSRSASGDSTTPTADWTQTITYQKDSVSLALTISFDCEHASLEWVVNWSYSGSNYSKRISDVRILNASFDINGAVMTTANQGGQNYVYDYQPYSVDLAQTPSYSMQNSGGRSSQGAWPYFDLTSAHNTYGIMGAIGWTGNWSCLFDYDTTGTVNVSAGMQQTDYQMKNGETLRTPSMVIQFFKGTQDDGHNAWRQLILDNYTPNKRNAAGEWEKVTYAPIAISTWGGLGTNPLISTLNEIKATGQYFEYQWIDAGWYGDAASSQSSEGVWGNQLGNWYYNPGYSDSSGNATDPNTGFYLTSGGFDALQEWHTANNTNLLVWFEPGRAMASSQMGSTATSSNPFTFVAQYKETPSGSTITKSVSWTTSYFLSGTSIVDYGNANALTFIKAVVLHYLDDMGCSFYRQDYNCNPVNGWTNKDTAENTAYQVSRTGVAEIKYVMGHYELLDAIIASGRQIDNCASGGRLLDIEMMKRSIPLWRTDYTVSGASIASGIRSQGANLSWWLPISGGSSSSQGVNTEYGFRSYMASGATMGKLNTAIAQKMIPELLYNRELMLGDYYILQQGLHEGLAMGVDTQHSNITCWLENDSSKDYTDITNAAYEFYLEEKGEGYLVAFRPGQSTVDTETFKLKGLDAHADYEVRDADTGETFVCTGRYLMEHGLKLTFPRVQTSHMIYFTKQ